MRTAYVTVSVALAILMSCAVSEAQVPSAIKLFDATPVTESAPCANPLDCSPVRDRVVFDEAALLLSCRSHPTAILSSTSDGRGGLVADNFIEVNGKNVCTGGSGANCFNPPVVEVIGTPAADAYQSVPPLDVSNQMPHKGPGTVTFSLVDYGGFYANTDVWLVTDCSVHHKAAICHKPGTNAEKILIVGLSAISGHLRHGDTLDLSACQR